MYCNGMGWIGSADELVAAVGAALEFDAATAAGASTAPPGEAVEAAARELHALFAGANAATYVCGADDARGCDARIIIGTPLLVVAKKAKKASPTSPFISFGVPCCRLPSLSLSLTHEPFPFTWHAVVSAFAVSVTASLACSTRYVPMEDTRLVSTDAMRKV